MRLRQPRMLGTGRQRVGDLEGERAVLDDPDSELARIAEGGRAASEALTKAAKAGDPTSMRSSPRWGGGSGRGSRGSMNVLDPEIVVVGGGAAEAVTSSWIDRVRSSRRWRAPTFAGRCRS